MLGQVGLARANLSEPGSIACCWKIGVGFVSAPCSQRRVPSPALVTSRDAKLVNEQKAVCIGGS